MNKIYLSSDVLTKKTSLNHFLLIMRTAVILLFTCVFISVAETGHSQNAKVSLNKNNVNLKEVLNEIENQTDYLFIYNNQVNTDKRVSVNTDNTTVKEVLTHILKDSDIDFLMEGNHIILTYIEEKLRERDEEVVETVKQQGKTITGTIVDAQGDPIIGANVIEKGTTNGTVTDYDGNFSLNVDENAILRISYIGYLEQEIATQSRSSFNIILQEDTKTLDELVVVGYGVQKAGEITGSVSSVASNDLERVAALDVGEAMRGKVSGVTISQSHTPGSSATIRVRGLGTINDNEPLWIVDGVPGGKVHPREIESISVLKDAAAQAIYGSRASNGVILVTTKSGRREQQLQIDITVTQGIKRNVREYDLLNTQEYGEMLWLQAKNDGITDYSHPQYGDGPTPHIPNYIRPTGAETADHSLYDNKFMHEDGTDTYIIMMANKEGTNWMKEATQDAHYQEYGVGLSGGGEKVNYAIQLGYMEEEGILIHTSYDRYNLRSNLTAKPTSWLELGQRVGMTYSESWGRQDNQDEASTIAYTFRNHPIIPVYDIMGNFAGSRAEATGIGRNTVFLQQSEKDNNNKEFVSTGNIYGEIAFLEGLTFRSLFGFNYNSIDGSFYHFPERAFSERSYYNNASKRSDSGLQYNWTNTLQYRKLMDMHNFTILLGSEKINNTMSWHGGRRISFFAEDPNYMQLDAGERDQSNFGNKTEWGLFSLFGRINYIFDNRFYLEAVVRRDGSSRFGKDSRYGTFPAFSFGWRLTNERFLESAKKSWLDDLMLRIGYGKTGNDRVGNYNAYSTYASSVSDSFYPIKGEDLGVGTPGFYPQSLGNIDVAWESTTTYNLGLDIGFKKHWDLSVDIWKRNTTDMLFPKRLPDVAGQVSPPSVNVGEMSNKGFDIELGYHSGEYRDFSYDASLFLSHYKNKVVRLSNVANERLEGSEFRNEIYTMAETGTAFPVFYGYQVDGIFQNEQEANNHANAFDGYNAPGRFKFRDINGDGIINSEDRMVLGDPHPDFTVGLNINLNYKKWSLSTHLYASYGNELVNYVNRWTDFHTFIGNRSKKRLYESWGSPYLKNNEDAKMPMVGFSEQVEQFPSSYYVEDASYLRMENLRLNYDFSELIGLNIRQLSVFAHVANVFTLTNYSGLDPEVNRTGVDMGVDVGSWPAPRTYMLGVNVGF